MSVTFCNYSVVELILFYGIIITETKNTEYKKTITPFKQKNAEKHGCKSTLANRVFCCDYFFLFLSAIEIAISTTAPTPTPITAMIYGGNFSVGFIG